MKMNTLIIGKQKIRLRSKEKMPTEIKLEDSECIYWFCKICTNHFAPKCGKSFCRGITDCDVYEIDEIKN